MKNWTWSLALALGLAGSVIAQDTAPIYKNDFEKADVDSVPADMLVIDGDFAVKAENGKKFLQLPGSPLETYGVLFGPTEKDNIAVTAKIYSTSKGRRYPTLTVGLNGVGGYKLQVAPAKKSVILKKGDDEIVTVPYDWKSDTWSNLRLQVRAVADGQWKIEGKVWAEGTPEPAAWTITYDEKTAPSPGRASIWGSPFAGTPIRFDDLVVTKAAAK